MGEGQPDWKAEDVLVFEAHNRADYMVNLCVTFYGGGNEVSVRIGIFPHWPVRIALPLEVAGGRVLFLKRTPGRFKAVVQGVNLDFDSLDGIRITTAEGSGGIRNTLTMEENAAAIPGLVGAHYFRWNDQHIMGRGDGENMQIGLHDITCRAYPEWVETCCAVHPGLYEIVDGRREPFSERPNTVPQGTLCW